MIKSTLRLKKWIINFKIGIFLFLIACLLSVGGIIAIPLDRETSVNHIRINEFGGTILSINSYQNHSPIIINGNTNFNDTAFTEGWNGNGTITNPYIITGLNITNIGGELIRIRNTDVYFIIKDCFFFGGHYGIYFSNVNNSYIFNNTISGSDIAIFIVNSNNNNFMQNNVSNNFLYGVELTNSASNTLANNILNDIQNGIWVGSSSNNIIFNNTFSNISNIALFFGQSAENRILNNSFSNNGMYLSEGDVLQNYLQTEVANNTVNGKPLIFWQNQVGGTVPSDAGQIILVNSESVNIVEQEISSAAIGIQLHLCTNITISNSIISNNKIGVLFSSSTFNRIHKTTFTRNHYGIQLWYSSINDFSENILINNSGRGFSIDESNENLIYRNTIFNCLYGLRLFQSNGNSLFSNIISDSLIGIDLTSLSSSNSIYDNIISNTSDYAMLLYSGPNNYIRWNNFINNTPSETSQVYEHSSSETKNIVEYNYWDDWTQPDSNNDGIVDLPYLIDGDTNNYDEYPLSSPFHLSTPVIIFPAGGETVNGIINIRWSSVRDLWNQSVTYTLYYSMNGGDSWNLIASDLDNTWYQWDTRTVPNGTEYMIKLNATSSVGLVIGDTSDTVFSILNEVITPPDPPQNFGVVAGELAVHLSWDPPSNDGGSPITSYYIYRGTSSGEYTLIFITSNTTYTDTFLTPQTKYYYVVTAVTNGGESTLSDEISAILNTPETSSNISTTTSKTSTSVTSTTTSKVTTSTSSSTSQVGSFVGVSFIVSSLIIAIIIKRRDRRLL